MNWLAQLEADNATHPNPVRMRWLADGPYAGVQVPLDLMEALEINDLFEPESPAGSIREAEGDEYSGGTGLVDQ